VSAREEKEKVVEEGDGRGGELCPERERDSERRASAPFVVGG